MKIDFYYWDMQCPLNNEMLKLLKKYDSRCEIHIHNVKGDFALAKKQRMFFPTLTVVNNVKRYFKPLNENFLNHLLQGKEAEEKPYFIQQERKIFTGEIFPLTKQNIEIACACTSRKSSENCHKKLKFLEDCCSDVFGFINVNDGKLLGGVEYVPSVLVPYDIPKSDKIAFLTCAYLSSKKYDYKTTPLKTLENFLKRKFDKLIAISGDRGVFPNGDLEWFLKNGFSDEYVISVELNYCKLHLVSKNL
ncbi:MAG: hypothetical protein PWQ77_2179 [Kosmotogales bacterium]|nr:hypothetical protein [Kosmotogales bacterium]